MSILVARHPELDFDERIEADAYPTPIALCREALRLLPVNFKPHAILDPGAGTGVWGIAARERWPYAVTVGVEYRDVPKPEGYTNWYRGDFLTVDMPYRFQLVIGNPPYGVDVTGKRDRKMAEKFVRRSMEYLIDGGYLLFLLRLNFFTTAERVHTLLDGDYPLLEVVPVLQRPSFKPGRDRKTGKLRENATDMTEYAIFIWRKGDAATPYRWLDWDNSHAT